MDIENTTWLITGASSGLGLETTRQLLAAGARVAATVRRPEALSGLAAEFGDRLWIATLDVTDTPRVREVVDRAFTDLGRIDVVVNSAGYGLFCSVEEATDAQIEQQLATNVVGSMQVVRAALPALRAQGGGRILQVSSAGGQTTYPNFGYYHASKWAIEGFCQTVAAEVAPFGVAVTIVEPGATATGFGAALATAPALPAYEDTPAGQVRRMLGAGEFPLPNDPVKVVAAVLAMVAEDRTPLRLPLGTDTFDDVRASLVERLENHDAHRDIARSVAL
jgi:NAD(P)-dependent dehydrogenase (short-subunit alcohol dehydrogenase family)